MPDTILVLSGNKAEYDKWCNQNPKLRNHAVWGESLGMIRKVESDVVVECGSFRALPDAQSLMSAAMEGLRAKRT